MAQLKHTSRSFKTALLTTMLFLSGLCGISYEILYARMLNNLIGDAFAVNASILVTFLAGIGFGTRYAYRFKRYLWAVEALIGVYAGLFVLVRHQIDALLFRILPAQSMAMNILASCILLAVPAFLVGISLPIFAAYLKTYVRERVFSVSYMVYNFGAALTALLVEFGLIRLFGIPDTVLILASLNLAIGIGLYFLSPQSDIQLQFPEEILYPVTILGGLFLFSMASAVFQLWAIKIAQFTFGPYHETFAMVLAIVLGGIAIGSFITRKWRIQFRTFLWTNISFVVLLLAFFPLIVELYALGFPVFEEKALLPWKVLTLFLIIGGSAICYGAAIPAIMQREQDVAKESGWLLFISSVANVAGYLLMVFVLHPLFEYGQILLITLIFSAVAVLWIYAKKTPAIAASVFALALGGLFLLTAWNEDILYLDYTSFTSHEDFQEELADYERGQRFRKYDETFAINTSGGNEYFFINGYTSIPLNSPPEYIVGAISTLLSPERDQALVLGLGSGATAGTVAELFRQVDVVEINPIIVEKQYLMRQYSFAIMAKPNVNVVVDDGIRFLKTTDANYDLIVNTVTTPLYFSST